MLKGVGLAVVGWIVLGSLVEARRDMHHHDDPQVMAVVEADLASRHCPGLRNDVDGVKRVAANKGMNHADFFTSKRSAAFTAQLATLRSQLKADPGPTCDSLWAAYGASGWRANLLKRV